MDQASGGTMAAWRNRQCDFGSAFQRHGFGFDDRPAYNPDSNFDLEPQHAEHSWEFSEEHGTGHQAIERRDVLPEHPTDRGSGESECDHVERTAGYIQQ